MDYSQMNDEIAARPLIHSSDHSQIQQKSMFIRAHLWFNAPRKYGF